MKDRIDRLLTFDRADFLGTRILLWLVLLGAPAVCVVLPALRWAAGEPLTWTVGVDQPQAPVAGGAEVLGSDLAVSVPDADTGTWLATLLPGLVLSLAVAAGCWLLLRLLGRIQRGEPFVTASVWSLRGVAGLLIITPLPVAVASGLAGSRVAEAALTDPHDGFVVDLAGVVVACLTGLLVGAVAEAFARGVQVQRDVEGLV